jgi:hypothetical protein
VIFASKVTNKLMSSPGRPASQVCGDLASLIFALLGDQLSALDRQLSPAFLRLVDRNLVLLDRHKIEVR